MSKNGLEMVKKIAEIMTKTKGFEKCLKELVIVSGGEGKCVAEFKVDEAKLNRGGGLHGGFTATVVDVVTTYALMSNDNPPGVSVDIHVSYLKGAKEGDDVIVNARTLKTGRNLAFLECELLHKKDNSLIAKGSHTKFIG